jgi:hypothetical protein
MLMVLIRVLLGLPHPRFDVLLRETTRSLDSDRLLLARGLVLSCNREDPVRIHVEGHLDLRNPARSRRNAIQDEPAEAPVVRRHVPLALEDVHLHLGLAVGRGGEDLGAFSRDRRISLEELRHDPAQRLDPERKGRDVEQQDVLHLSGQNTRLDGGAHGHDLVRIHSPV